MYCKNCCKSYIPVEFTSYEDKVRVCKFCFNLLEPLYQKHLCDSNSNRANSIILSYDALKQKSADELNEKEADQVEASNANEPVTVVTLRVKNDNSQNNSSSSSMTEEQIKVLSSIFKEEDQQKKCDTDSASTEFDSDLNDNDQSKEFKSLNLTENDAEPEINNTNISDTNTSVDSPHQTENIFEEKVNLRKKIQFLNTQTESTPVKEIHRSRNESTKALADKFKREIVHFEYGDMCKMAMSNKHDDSDEVEQEDTHNKIWNRYNIVFFSDKTIGICFNQNVI